jgi:hypothetical protein
LPAASRSTPSTWLPSAAPRSLPYPRDRASPRFLDLERQIKKLVREEVLKLGVN